MRVSPLLSCLAVLCAAPCLEVTDSRVQMARCSLLALPFAPSQLGPGIDGYGGTTAMLAAQSTLWITQSTLTAGSAGQPRLNGNGGSGGVGLALTAQSRVQIWGATSITGGSGSSGMLFGSPGRGGDGIQADGTCEVAAWGGSLVGGKGGLGTFGGNGADGQPYSGPVTWLEGRATPELTTSGTLVPNGTVELRLLATPSSVAVLAVGTEPVAAPVPFLQIGALFVTPGIVFGPFLTDANGALALPITIPPDYPGLTPAFVQFACIDAAHATFAASGAALLLGRY